MPSIRSSVLALFIISTINSFSQSSSPFQEYNLNYKYDISNFLDFKYRNYFQEDSIKIIFSITLNEAAAGRWYDDFTFFFNYREDYKTPEILKADTLEMNQFFLGKRQNTYLFFDKIARDNSFDLIVLNVISEKANVNYQFDINLNEGANYSNDNIEMYDASDGLPILDKFIPTGQAVKFIKSNNQNDELWAYYYDTDFDVAVPPMIVDNANTSRSLSVAKTIRLQNNSPVRFEEEGLYFVQSDTTSLTGMAFRVQSEPYPRFGTYQKLLKPLKYISTKEESENLFSAENLKVAFENYWFALMSSHNLAQNSIKDYYNRIYEANFYFTDYKEGWKTDMGMIYTVYGAPSKVYRHDEYEEWIYNQNINMPAIRFTFVKIKNVFADNHYTLVRDRKFDKHWFRSVELWRSGKK